MSELELPKFMFFDANPLIGMGWPKRSVEFENIILLSDKFGIKLGIPEVFRLEIRKNFQRRASSAISKLRGLERNLRNLKRSVAVPELDHVLAEYDQGTMDYFKEREFIVVPLPGVELERIVNLAVDEHPPFGEKDKGFRDTVGLFSILEYLQREGEDSLAFLISEDTALHDSKVQKLIDGHGVRLEIIDTLNTLQKRLQGYLDAQEQLKIEEERRLVKQALESAIPQIEKYLIAKYVLRSATYYDLGIISPLSDVKVKEIISASVASTDETGVVSISFEMICELKSEERVLTISTGIAGLTTSVSGLSGLSGLSSSVRDFSEEKPFSQYPQGIIRREFVGEATAVRRAGELSDLTITSITPKSVFYEESTDWLTDVFKPQERDK